MMNEKKLFIICGFNFFFQIKSNQTKLNHKKKVE
jgi:hypothetical protein